MKRRFILYRRKRGGMFYIEDTETRKQESTGTRNRAEATALLNARNESVRQPQLADGRLLDASYREFLPGYCHSSRSRNTFARWRRANADAAVRRSRPAWQVLQGGFPLAAHGFLLTTAELTTKEAKVTTRCG